MNRRDEALEQFALARTIIEELAAGLPDGVLRTEFLNRALALLPAPPAPTLRRAEMKEWGGLTGREREVAALIAEGKSNREIAETLVLTVRTVEAHITRILTKLDLKSPCGPSQEDWRALPPKTVRCPCPYCVVFHDDAIRARC